MDWNGVRSRHFRRVADNGALVDAPALMKTAVNQSQRGEQKGYRVGGGNANCICSDGNIVQPPNTATAFSANMKLDARRWSVCSKLR